MSAHSLPGVVYPHAITPRGHMDMDWTGLWRVDSPHTSLPVDTAHTHTLTMESFVTAGDVYSATGVSYDAHAALDGALRYAAVDSNIGAESVRKLVKTVQMLADPDMEEYLAQTTRKFCEHMFNMCELVKGIGEDDAMVGLKLIAVVRGLFLMGMVVSADCPVVWTRRVCVTSESS